jgi:Uncharacterised nucleotidyltransferase
VTSSRLQQVNSLSLEEQLLLGSVRHFLHHNNDAVIEALLQKPVAWETLLELADEHRLFPVLHEVLRHYPLPEHVLAELKDVARDTMLVNLSLNHHLREVLLALETETIPVLVFKGLVLAATMYGNLGLREFADLDLLVRPEDFDQATAVLVRLGFEVELNTHWEIHFIHPERGCAVDLHRSLTPRFMPMKLRFEDFMASAQRVTIAGTTLTTLALEDAIILQCVHLVKDCWDVKTHFRNHLRFHKLCDLARSLQHPNLEWPRLVLRAQAMRAERMLLFGLKLTHDLLGSVLPEGLQSKILRNPLLLSLAADSSDWFFGKRTLASSSISGIIFEVSLRDSFWDRAELFFRPTQEDKSSLQLPPHLHFLYYFTRPFRLLAIYGSWWLKAQVHPE